MRPRKISPWFQRGSYLINSNRGHAVGAGRCAVDKTDITKCKNVSMMQPKRLAVVEFLIKSKVNIKVNMLIDFQFLQSKVNS